MSDYENKAEDRTRGKYKNVVIMKYRKQIFLIIQEVKQWQTKADKEKFVKNKNGGKLYHLYRDMFWRWKLPQTRKYAHSRVTACLY